jgi:hypothetical protein
MSTIFSIVLPEHGAKVRKTYAPKTRVVRDRTRYSRKRKHRGGCACRGDGE